jgi:CD36 family
MKFARKQNLDFRRQRKITCANLTERVFVLTLQMFDAGQDNVTMNAASLNIDTYNGQTMLHSLNSSDVCDERLRGVSEGVIFQQHVARNRSLSVYRKGFCRTLAIQFEKEEPAENVNGNPGGLRFVIPPHAFNATRNVEHACHCGRKTAADACTLPDGLSDITNCYYGKSDSCLIVPLNFWLHF